MARAEVGTAKHQAKKLKASGLQQLKFYCQLCHKQCRDANGYKNHLLSPSHRGRVEQMEEKGTKKVTEDFSRQFLNAFVTLLRVSHGSKSVDANKFYQEYIANDRDHVHMNSTKWSTLTLFVKFLGKNSYVRVKQPDDQDDHGFLISYIDHSSLSVDKLLQKSAEDEQSRKFLEQQMEAGKTRVIRKEAKVPETQALPKDGIIIQRKANIPGPRKSATAFEDSDSDVSEAEKPKKVPKLAETSRKILGR